MKKLLFVSTRQFWPINSGKTYTLYYNCKGLHEECGYDIYLFCFADKSADKSLEKPDFIKDVVYADVPKTKTIVGNVLKYSYGQKQWPLQVSLYYDPQNYKSLQKYFDCVAPDAIVVDMVRLIPYIEICKENPFKKILLEDDLLSKRYSRQIKSNDSDNVAGFYQKSLPSPIKKFMELPFVKKFILKSEIRKLDKFERKSIDLFDHITFISPIEASEYNTKYSTNKAVTLTAGTDIEYYSQDIQCSKKENSLSIVGNFEYAPNEASIKWMAENVLNKLDKETKCYVMGKFPDKLKEFINNDHLVIMGYVDDIRKEVQSTEVYFAPIVFGTGIKIKIIEAMAMGMPVVTNSIGAEGLNVKSGSELFIADDPDEMVCLIKQLLSDQDLRTQVGRNARAFVKKYHDWKEIYKVFKELGL